MADRPSCKRCGRTGSSVIHSSYLRGYYCPKCHGAAMDNDAAEVAALRKQAAKDVYKMAEAIYRKE